MTTFTDFADIEATHELAAAVLDQLGYDDRDEGEFDDALSALENVNRGGADGGFAGFTYHSDTLDFAQRHRDAIIQLATRDADDLGHDGGAFALIATFRYIREAGIDASEVATAVYDQESDEYARTVVLNSLAWYALESVSQSVDR